MNCSGLIFEEVHIFYPSRSPPVMNLNCFINLICSNVNYYYSYLDVKKVRNNKEYTAFSLVNNKKRIAIMNPLDHN